MKNKNSVVTIFIGIIAVLCFTFLQPEKNHYLTILHTNDVHGRLLPINYDKDQQNVGGFARRANLIKQIKATNKNVLALDAGDFAQGSLIFNFFNGIPDIEMISDAGYDVITLGNHEFDKGLGVLKKIVQSSTIPIVSANLEFTEDAELNQLIKPYTIKQYYGLKVAVIGVVAENLKVLARNLNEVKVFSTKDVVKNLLKEVKPKADIVIVLSHIGLEKDIELAKEVQGIDIIIGGHSHTLMEKPMLVKNGDHSTLIMQAGEFGLNLGRLDLKIKNKGIKDYYYSLIPVNSNLEEEKVFAEKIAKLNKKIEHLTNDKIGVLAEPIDARVDKVRSGITKAGVLVANSIKAKFPNVDIVLQNAGGIRAHKYIPAGDLTTADILRLYPFNNFIVIVDISGKDLKSILETSARKLPRPSGALLQSVGLEYTIDLTKPFQQLSADETRLLEEGSRVLNVKINGQPLKDDKLYTVAINDYVFYGGNGYFQFKNSQNIYHTGVLVSDLIIEYIKNNSPVSVKMADEVKVISSKGETEK